MHPRKKSTWAVLLLALLTANLCAASAYNARPKLVVIVIVDQFRADYLERYHDQFVENGFRLFTDKGANFTDCNYDYANTRTGPGHATLFTGAYSNGHGIMANEWWDPAKKRRVTAVEDDATKVLGVSGGGTGSSPRNLLGDTLGDELKLATQGKSRVFSIALKERASVLPGGFAADAAYWIDHASGAFVTSTYYMQATPEWVTKFNAEKRGEKYWNVDWKDNGKVLRTTTPRKDKNGKPLGFYDVVGATPFANDYQLEFARDLVANEKPGTGSVTDLLVLSFSSYDILGHEVGPDSPEMRAMALALDRQLADFFAFLGRQVGLANIWIALSADHGIAPLPAVASKLRIPATNADSNQIRARLNAALTAKFSPGRAAEYVRMFEWPLAYLSEDTFAAAKVKEEDAERTVGELLAPYGIKEFYTRAQLASGNVRQDDWGRKYLHSYSPYGGWYVLGVPNPFLVGWPTGTDHATPYSYDTHVPLALFGLPFKPGAYRTHCEPVDLASTLASLLGINPPAKAVGRVLHEAIRSGTPEAAAPAEGAR